MQCVGRAHACPRCGALRSRHVAASACHVTVSRQSLRLQCMWMECAGVLHTRVLAALELFTPALRCHVFLLSASTAAHARQRQPAPAHNVTSMVAGDGLLGQWRGRRGAVARATGVGDAGDLHSKRFPSFPSFPRLRHACSTHTRVSHTHTHTRVPHSKSPGAAHTLGANTRLHLRVRTRPPHIHISAAHRHAIDESTQPNHHESAMFYLCMSVNLLHERIHMYRRSPHGNNLPWRRHSCEPLQADRCTVHTHGPLPMCGSLTAYTHLELETPTAYVCLVHNNTCWCGGKVRAVVSAFVPAHSPCHRGH
jgi:hypothetical protein